MGVLGAGHLGKIHLKLLAESDCYELMGFYDPNDRNAARAMEKFGVRSFDRMEELMDAVEVVDIVTPTLSHFDCAMEALSRSKHLFIEKPMTSTVEEARKLLEASEQSGIKIQVGHVERYNPAYLAIREMPLDPRFIEAHRLAVFNPRGTDVSVVHDLMIHDLDIILSMVSSPIADVKASGVGVLSGTPDIANARIEFENGCIANVTASRISMKNMRKTRLFQKDAYITMDFLEKKTEIFRLSEERGDNENAIELILDQQGNKKFIHLELPETAPVNAIKMELEQFAESISQDTEPEVNVKDAYRALHLAGRILEEIDKNLNLQKK